MHFRIAALRIQYLESSKRYAMGAGNVGVITLILQAAGDLGLEIQFDILEAIGRLTFTRGFAPFAERIMALANAANSASFSKVPDMKLPEASKPSSPPDTPQA